MTKWQSFLEQISKIKIGDTLLRRDLTDANKVTTMDNYRMLLSKLGVFETIAPGEYKKLRNIRTDITLRYVRELSENSWKSWFVKID